MLCFVVASLSLREKNCRVVNVRLCGAQGPRSVAASEGALPDETRFAMAMALSAALPSIT